MKDFGRTSRHSRQAGMASIVITMVTMVVISLIVLGFATISRREQRNSLDQVLSAQAFYAAESGVDDARNVIREYLATHPGQTAPAKTSCASDDSGLNIYPTGDSMKVDTTYDVSYSCLKVDPAPESVKFDGVGDSPVVIPITTPTPITSLKITWKPTSAPANPPSTCPAVPSATDKVFAPQAGGNAWKCGYGVLKVDAVTTNNGGNVTRAALGASQLDAYLLPTRGNPAGSLDYNGNRGHANLVPVNCNAASGVYGSCTATLTNIPGGNRTMTLRISSTYQPSTVTVQALTGVNPQPISGVQASIDSTGRATDTLRRVEVRLPLNQGSSIFPSQPVTSGGSICKRFSVTTGYFNIPGDIQDADAANAMCAAKTSGTPSP